MSVPATEDISVSKTPDLRLSTSILDNVLLSTSIVLFVKVCEPVKVATVESIATVNVLPEPDVSIPVPPAISRVSLSKSIDNAPPESPWKSKSCAVI